MIREFEKKILKKIDFANKFLLNKLVFVEKKTNPPVFKKDEILKMFKELGYQCKYKSGGWYEILITYNEYNFKLATQIKLNSPLFYINMYKNGLFIEDANLGHYSYMLNYLPYNEKLINNNFRLNSLDDLKKYIKEMILIFEEFVNEYIKEINAGNNPESK